MKDKKKVDLTEDNMKTKRVIRGEFKDTIIRKKGRKETIEEREWTKNLIVENAGKLVAGLMKDEGTFTGGILYHAIGHGDVSWDTSIPPAVVSDTTLYDEHFRKVPDSINYLDEGNNIVAYVTDKIEITTTYDFGDSGANGSIREQGLFGGNATATKDSGYMVDEIRHTEIYKDATVKVIRRIRLQF